MVICYVQARGKSIAPMAAKADGTRKARDCGRGSPRKPVADEKNVRVNSKKGTPKVVGSRN